MFSLPPPNTIGVAGTILSICPMAIWTLHIFTMRNGTFEQFLKYVDSNTLPSGKSFQSWNTGGRFSRVDWQIRAVGIFISCFTEDLSRPATSLNGFLFAGSWGSAWLLMVMESFRAVNRGHWLSYLAIPGYLIFHHAHGLFTPLYLVLAILFLPSCKVQNQTPEALFIEHRHLEAIPISFAIGYVLPISLMCLAAPRFLSYRFKDTVTGLYQQWHLIIEAVHYTVVWSTSCMVRSGMSRLEYSPETSGLTLELMRTNYVVAMALTALPYWVVSIFSVASWLAPTLFNPKIVHSLHPKWVLVPTWPRKNLKASDPRDGFRWLIQWDILLGTTAVVIWAMALRTYAAEKQNMWANSWWRYFLKAVGYFFVGGPNGIAVGFMWERDEIAFGRLR